MLILVIYLILRTMKVPDAPKTPHWLQKIQYLTDPLSYMESAYQRYGDIFNSLQQQIDQLLYAEISHRRTQYDPESTDILTLLMSVRDEDGLEMSPQELHDELITLSCRLDQLPLTLSIP